MVNKQSYEVVESEDIPNEWRVESIDSDTYHLARFYGDDARERAEAYATWVAVVE